MEKVLKFIDFYTTRIALFLLFVLLFRSCSTNSKIERLENDSNARIDSLINKVDNMDENLRKEIEIEGLRSERRMIDATDRKIFDVARQNEIDKQIQQLQK
jgi:hypothetical protein